jgi:hypothetical protein
MAHPQVVDGEESLQLQKLAANIVNKQSQPTRNNPTAFGLGMGLKTRHKK